jgi:DNA-directed RNA polymerase, mitochondrial
VPLDHIGGKKSTFVKNLHAAGSRIMEIHEQTERLALSKTVRFEQEIEAPRLSSADVIIHENAVDPDLDLLASLNEEILIDQDDEADADTRLLAGKFVNFTDLLPPLPAKGSFKVENIKGSQYFFS